MHVPHKGHLQTIRSTHRMPRCISHSFRPCDTDKPARTPILRNIPVLSVPQESGSAHHRKLPVPSWSCIPEHTSGYHVERSQQTPHNTPWPVRNLSFWRQLLPDGKWSCVRSETYHMPLIKVLCCLRNDLFFRIFRLHLPVHLHS